MAVAGRGSERSGNCIGDGPSREVEEMRRPRTGDSYHGTGVDLTEQESGIPWPFENLWPRGRPYTWMYEESDPNGGSSLSMVWVVRPSLEEDLDTGPAIPRPRWADDAARLELTIVVEHNMTEELWSVMRGMIRFGGPIRSIMGRFRC